MSRPRVVIVGAGFGGIECAKKLNGGPVDVWLVDQMYRKFQEDPDSVSASWQEFFADHRPGDHGFESPTELDEPVEVRPVAAPAEAAEAYETRAGMTPAAARGEAVKNSMFPGCAAMYLLGTDRIHALRRRLGEIEGSGFDLGAFHDQFLSFGSIPVTLIAEEMEARAGRREGRHDA